MSNYTVVYFTAIKRGFSVPSVLAEFSIFGIDISIKWYGAIIAFGFLLAVLFGGRMAYKWKMNLDKMVDVLIYGTLAGIVGARLYYVFSKWDYYGAHLSEIPKIWEGGLAIYGGLIAGVVAAYIVCRARKMNFWNLLDIAVMSFLIGQGIGRWGNFTNQEAFGTITNGDFGMMSRKVADYIAANPDKFGLSGTENVYAYISENNIRVHPTFFYESVSCILGFLVLYIILKKCRKFSGQMFLLYGVWYGIERAVVEGLRTDSLYIGSTDIRVSQALSLVLAVVCLAIFIIKLLSVLKNPKPIEGVDYYFDKYGEKQDMPPKKKKVKASKAVGGENEGGGENG